MARSSFRDFLPILAAGLLILISTGSCASPPELEPILDLVQAFPSADLSSERTLVDLGTPEGGSHLVGGWSWREKSRDGTTFVWSSGRESVLEFFVSEPRDVEVSTRCIAYPFDDGDPQTVAVTVGGRTISEFEVPSSWRETSFFVPADALEAGVNEMTFEYSRVSGEGAMRGADRPLAVAFDWLRFGGLETGSAGTPAAEPGLLTLGVGSRLDYFFEAPSGALLSIDTLEFRDGEGTLSITLERDGGADKELLAEVKGPKKGARWHIDRDGGIFRLRFEATAGENGGNETVVALTRPQILAPGSREEQSRAQLAPRGEASLPAAAEHPNVILYVVDTLRADHLGTYGYSKPITPELDTFAAEGVTFEAAVAQAPWTLPAMASVFTGLSPKTHGANTKQSRLPSDVATLADLLHDAGYSTGAVVANGFVSEAFGFNRGFDSFEFFPSLDTRIEELIASGLNWLDATGGERPSFLFVHAIDPHDSYDPPARFLHGEISGSGEDRVGHREAMTVLKNSREAPSPDLVADLLALYDGEIAYTDWAFGRFLDELDSRGLLDSSLVIFMSDHGEEFYDHGYWLHGHSLHSELTDIPMMIKFPGGLSAGERVPAAVQQIDLIPTVAEYLGLPRPPGIEGRSLLEHLGKSTAGGSQPVFSFLKNRLVSVVYGDWKLIAHPVGGKLRRRALYDRSSDRRETKDLAEERPIVTGLLTSMITEQLLAQRKQVASSRAVLDPEMQQHLKALGYLD